MAETLKYLKQRVVEHTTYGDKVIHIENVSYDLANLLSELMNERYDSYFASEDMTDENSTR